MALARSKRASMVVRSVAVKQIRLRTWASIAGSMVWVIPLSGVVSTRRRVLMYYVMGADLARSFDRQDPHQLLFFL